MPIYLDQPFPFNQFQHSLMIADVPSRDGSPASLRIQFRYRYLSYLWKLIGYEVEQPSSIADAELLANRSRLPRNTAGSLGQRATRPKSGVIFVHTDHWANQSRLFDAIDHTEVGLQFVPFETHSQRERSSEEGVIPDIGAA